MRLRIHLGLNTKALTWWLTTIRTAGQDEGLWRIKQRFCFVTIVTEVQTGLLIKGKHDTIKFFLLISPKNKIKYKKHFFAQRVRSISLWATYPYFLDEAFLVQTNYVDFRNDREKFCVKFCQFSLTIFHILSHPSGYSCYKFESFQVEVLKYHPKVIECLWPV